MKNKKWVLIGTFGVDSGQVLITDPCYLGGFKNDDFNPDDSGTDTDYSYSGACHATLNKPNMGDQLGGGLGVAISTGYGDGEYPVFALIEGGRVKEVKIKFF